MNVYPGLRWIAAVLLMAIGWTGAAHAERHGIPVCVVRAAPGMHPRALFDAPGRFDCTTPQAQFGGGDYWLLSASLPPQEPQPNTVATPIVVRSASLWQRRSTLYALYADGAIVALSTDDHAATRHLQLGATFQSVLPHREPALVRLLWHVEGSPNLRGIVLGASIATLGDAATANIAMAAFYAGFAGLCIALLVYNVALWGAMRHRFQLIYCAMVIALLAYAFSSSGALAWAFPQIANTQRIRINYLALAFSAVGAMAFARSFFEPAVFAGWVGRLSRWAVAAVLASAIAYALLAPWQMHLLDRIYTLALLSLIALSAPIVWRAWQQRSAYMPVFALSWAAPIVLAGLRILSGFHFVAWSFWLDNSTILSMTAEALLSSLAIAYRIRLLGRERDEARAQEIAARLLADTDPLTGLLNRRAFLREAIGRQDQQMLLIVDIDHFKGVNETLGHDGGDEVLRLFATTLSRAITAGAIVARLGGEEFAILTPASQPIRPAALLERLRAAPMPFDLTVTASIGVSRGPLATEVEWKALYRDADRALFEAKAAGRDRARERLRPAA
jgi:diguanylate cyclase (GGDEF)-like protein